MQGQKQLFSFIVIMIFVFTFSFYKSAMKNEKQIKQIREDELRKRLESSALQMARKDKINDHQRQLHEKYLQKLLEHKDICYDIHAIIFRPDSIERSTNSNGMKKVQNGNWKEVVDHSADTKSKNSVITGPIVYMCVIVLIGSLVKAAMDISNQLRKKSDEDTSDPRRCSLQEYANNNKRDRRSSRAPNLRRATTLTMEPRLSPKHHSLDERRFSYAIPDFNNGAGLITEPGTPAKSINGIASRPAPLLRRCSVPAFALQQAGHGSKLRRPSMDSFSEDDSSPDVKRRVRMIHRH